MRMSERSIGGEPQKARGGAPQTYPPAGVEKRHRPPPHVGRESAGVHKARPRQPLPWQDQETHFAALKTEAHCSRQRSPRNLKRATPSLGLGFEKVTLRRYRFGPNQQLIVRASERGRESTKCRVCSWRAGCRPATHPQLLR